MTHSSFPRPIPEPQPDRSKTGAVNEALTPVEKAMQRVNFEQIAALDRGDEFKLDTIKLLLKRLGSPHDRLRIIHIAGTKGKGSTAQFISRMGSAVGLKTAIYSSPHFERYTERFQIDNREIEESTLNPSLQRVLEAAEEMDTEIKEGQLDIHPATFFDISTAAAFQLFADQGVELVALEVGLGGRLDSTNACQSEIAVITSISLDHTRQLGNTTTQIAAEKAGIIKSETPVVCGPVSADVKYVIRSKADQHSASPVFAGDDFGPIKGSIQVDRDRVKFDYFDHASNSGIDDIEILMLGSHQVDNACVAIASMLRFCQKYDLLTADWQKQIRKGIAATRLTGRLEIVSRDPWIVADMAHNPASIEAMIDGLKHLNVEGRRQVIFSCSQDKDHLPMLRSLGTYFDRVIFTEYQKNPRRRSAIELAQHLEEWIENSGNQNGEKMSIDVLRIEDPDDALAAAQSDLNQYPLTVICGSIFLVGELMPSLTRLQDS